jgi:hypothetical protein
LQRASLTLPSQEQQRQWLREYELALLAKGYSDDKYHYMGDGDDQWRYCRFLATEAGLMSNSSSKYATNDPKWFVRTDESESANTCANASASANASSIISISSAMIPCSPPLIPVPVPEQEDVGAVSRYINKLETLYNKNLSLRPKYPGDNDTYRSVSYENEVLCNL